MTFRMDSLRARGDRTLARSLSTTFAALLLGDFTDEPDFVLWLLIPTDLLGVGQQTSRDISILHIPPDATIAGFYRQGLFQFGHTETFIEAQGIAGAHFYGHADTDFSTRS